MTEQEWRICTDPDRMLDYHSMKYARRRLRLLACAFVRRVWGRVEEPFRPAHCEVALALEP